MYPTCRMIAEYLDRELRTVDIPDNSLNGLQVSGQRKVRKIALAVDASLDTFEQAVAAKTDLVIVHHGLFWGQAERLTGCLYRRIRILVENGIGLYASHLPLDLHPRLGNNALLAKGLKLLNPRPFGHYHGVEIGIGGRFYSPRTTTVIIQKLKRLLGVQPKLFAFGREKISRLAVVSGAGGGDILAEAALNDYDAYLTGEMTHQLYHIAKENKITVFAGGHYATETMGIRALGGLLKKKYGVASIFLDLPTGL